MKRAIAQRAHPSPQSFAATAPARAVPVSFLSWTPVPVSASAGLRTPKKDPDDLSADLLDKLKEFHTPYDVNEFLVRLVFLLVRNRISLKRAGVLTYVAAQLLHSLSEVRLVEKAKKDERVQIICDGPRPNRDWLRELS